MIDYLVSNLIYAIRKHLASPTFPLNFVSAHQGVKAAQANCGLLGSAPLAETSSAYNDWSLEENLNWVHYHLHMFVRPCHPIRELSDKSQLYVRRRRTRNGFGTLALGGRWHRLFNKFIPKPQTPFSAESLLFCGNFDDAYFDSMH